MMKSKKFIYFTSDLRKRFAGIISMVSNRIIDFHPNPPFHTPQISGIRWRDRLNPILRVPPVLDGSITASLSADTD